MDDRIANELVTAVEKLVEKLDKIERHLRNSEARQENIESSLHLLAVSHHELAAAATVWEELIGGNDDDGRYLRIGER